MKRSKVKKVQGYYICAIIISVLFSFWYFFMRPPREVEGFIAGFIESFDEESMAKPESFIADSLDNRSFIAYCRVNRQIRFEIVNTKRRSSDTFETNVKLQISAGSVLCSLRTTKTRSGYKISRMPSIDVIKSCLPVMSEEKGKQIFCTVDIAGKSYTFKSLPAILPETNRPSSITLLGDTIIQSSGLSCIEAEKVLSVSQDGIEIRSAETAPVVPIIPIDSVLHVYEMKDGNIRYMGNRMIPPGAKGVKIYLLPGGKAITAIYQQEKLPFETIRVAIGRTGFSGLVHERVVIDSDEGFTVSVYFPSKSSYSFSHSQKATITRKGHGISVASDGIEVLYAENRLYISPERNGTIKLYGLERAQSSGLGYTRYNGVFEISPLMSGMSIVNEVSLEEYLCSVVSSEMPSAFGLEPLKAQAVAARTYAMNSVLRSGFSSYGANVDDSTASQVYNNVAAKGEAIQAVEATRGLVLLYDGQLADTRYFSTSCGYTASSCEVWEDNEGNFPGKPVDYLPTQPQYPGKPVNLSTDRQMKSFLEQDRTGFYDAYSPYFRWEVTMTGHQVEAAIRHNLGLINEEELPQDIGRLMNIKTMRRGSGGNIIHLLIKTTSGEYNVYKELNIRKILQPVNRVNGEPPVILRLSDGSIRENFPLLPSSFAVIETVKDKSGYIESVTIKGGGFGHGAGMSQYGAYGLALSGYPFEKILLHYYPGTELKKMY